MSTQCPFCWLPASRPWNLRRQRGLSLIETLLALAIGAGLLVAVSSAVLAFGDSWRANSDADRAMHTARLALFRICSEIRQAKEGQVTNSTTLSLVSSAGPTRTFSLAGNTLSYSPDSAADPVVLARDVSALTFVGQMDPLGSHLVNVQVRMAVALKSGAVVLCDSAILRNNRVLPDHVYPNPTVSTGVNPPPY